MYVYTHTHTHTRTLLGRVQIICRFRGWLFFPLLICKDSFYILDISLVKLLFCKYCLLVSRQYFYFLMVSFEFFFMLIYQHINMVFVTKFLLLTNSVYHIFLLLELYLPQGHANILFFPRKFIVLCFCVKLILSIV